MNPIRSWKIIEVTGWKWTRHAVLYKVYTNVCNIQCAIKLPISHLLKLHPETHKQCYSVLSNILGRFIKFITFIKRSLEAFLLTEVALPPLAVLNMTGNFKCLVYCWMRCGLIVGYGFTLTGFLVDKGRAQWFNLPVIIFHSMFLF
jgi:hypothetical protein